MAFKLTGNVLEVIVPQEKMLKLKEVMEAILRQVDGEVVLEFDDVPDSHFAALMRSYKQTEIVKLGLWNVKAELYNVKVKTPIAEYFAYSRDHLRA